MRDGSKQWALSAQWHSSGRYLAVFNTIGELPVPFIEVTMIDTFSGEKFLLNIEKSGNKYAMAWAPNSNDLLVIAQNVERDDYHNLYLVDVNTKKSRQILQDFSFMFTGFSGVDWSPDGQFIALVYMSLKQENLRQLGIIEVGVK